MAEALKAGIFIGTVLLIGAGLFGRFVGPESLTFAGMRRLKLGMAAGAVILIASSWLDVGSVLMRSIGAIELELFTEYLLHTRHGQATLARTILALTVLALGVGAVLPRAADRLTFLALALGLLASVSWVSHSGVMGAWPFIGDLAHTAAATLWAGALFYLAWAASWKQSGGEGGSHPGLEKAVGRVSSIGLYCLLLLMATGAYMSLLHMFGLAALTTSYGGALIVKIKLVSVIVILAAVNRILLVPMLEQEGNRRPLAFAVRFESVLLIGVLVATGVLATREPPHDHPGAAIAGAEHPHPIGFDDVPEGASGAVGANRLSLPAGVLAVTPTADGDIAVELRAQESAGLMLSAASPSGENFDLIGSGSGSFSLRPHEDVRVALPADEEGVWVLRGELDGTAFEAHLYRQRIALPSGRALELHLVPAPSMSGGGATELFFAPATEADQFAGPVLLQYRRFEAESVLASTVATEREPNSRYGPSLKNAMLRFPNAGAYEVRLAVLGEETTISLEVAP